MRILKDLTYLLKRNPRCARCRRFLPKSAEAFGDLCPKCGADDSVLEQKRKERVEEENREEVEPF